MKVTIRPFVDEDRPWVLERTEQLFGGKIVVTKGRIHDPAALPGFLAVRGDTPCGLATFVGEGAETELVSLDVLLPGLGIGTKLLTAVEKEAKAAGCARLWLVVTNDNLRALHFYQRRGFELVRVHRNAMEEVRKLKPTLPLLGIDGIPLRDEIELEKAL